MQYNEWMRLDGDVQANASDIGKRKGDYVFVALEPYARVFFMRISFGFIQIKESVDTEFYGEYSEAYGTWEDAEKGFKNKVGFDLPVCPSGFRETFEAIKEEEKKVTEIPSEVSVEIRGIEQNGVNISGALSDTLTFIGVLEYLAFSDGTLLKCSHSEYGRCVIDVVVQGRCKIMRDTTGKTDIITLVGPVGDLAWVVAGICYAPSNYVPK